MPEMDHPREDRAAEDMVRRGGEGTGKHQGFFSTCVGSGALHTNSISDCHWE